MYALYFLIKYETQAMKYMPIFQSSKCRLEISLVNVHFLWWEYLLIDIAKE